MFRLEFVTACLDWIRHLHCGFEIKKGSDEIEWTRDENESEWQRPTQEACT